MRALFKPIGCDLPGRRRRRHLVGMLLCGSLVTLADQTFSIPEAYFNAGRFYISFLKINCADRDGAVSDLCEPCLNPLSSTCRDDGSDLTWYGSLVSNFLNHPDPLVVSDAGAVLVSGTCTLW